MAHNFCSHCGAPLMQGGGFCPQCGTTVSPPGTQQTTAQPMAPFSPNGYPGYNGVAHPMVYGPQVTFVKPVVPGRGYATSSMILGIIGMVYAFLSFMMALTSFLEYEAREISLRSMKGSAAGVMAVSLVMSILSVLSFIFAMCAFSRGYKGGRSVSGLILSTAGFLLFVCSVIIVAPFL